MLNLVATLVATVFASFAPPTVAYARPLSPVVPVVVQEVPLIDVTQATSTPETIDSTLCNCWKYTLSKRKIPRMADIVSNTTPHVGAVAIFYYKDKTTGERIKHIALIVALDDSGFTVSESNFTKCSQSTRHISWDDSHLAGFYE